MTTLESKIFIGDDSYSVAALLRNMRTAFSKDEALRWGFCIQRAFLEFGYSPDIDRTMQSILASQAVPPIVAKAEERTDSDMGMPQPLINYIFNSTFNQEQLKKLWLWIKQFSIDSIRFPYQYLSLLLFFENRHSSLLQKPRISNAEMQTQMTAWFPEAKVNCSADSLGTYRNGFIDSYKFNYLSWLNSNGEPPKGNEYKRDQSLSGFQALVRLCNELELNCSELKI